MSTRYGYGQSKPQVNYHQQNSEYVTTVIKEISRMTVNQKPIYGGGDVQKSKVCTEEVVEEKNCGYNSGYHGGDAAVVQKHDYKHEEAFEHKDSGYNGYKHEAAFEDHGYQHGGGAVQKQGYKQEVFEANAADSYGGYHGGGGGVVKQKHEYHHEEAFDGAVKNKHGGYGYGHGAYGEAAGYSAPHHGGGGDMHKYGHQKEAYGAKADAGGYGSGGGYYGGGANNHKLTTKKHQAAYGGPVTGAVQQHNYYQDAYDEADAAAGMAGYGSAYFGGGGAMHQMHGGYNQKAAGYGGGEMMMQKHGGYKQQEMYGGGYHGDAYSHYNTVHGPAAKTEFAGGHRNGAYYASDSDCDESDDESDCEEAFVVGHHGNKLGGGGGGVRRYESYERHEENLGGGHRYESYKTSIHEGHAGGGAGYGACAPPRKNRLFF